MPLLQLPPETLYTIFTYVGPSFFHKDARRLSICKRWFEFALPTSLQCVAISPKSLRKLVCVEDSAKPLSFVETLELNMSGYGDWGSEGSVKEYTRGFVCSNGRQMSWKEVLDHDLVELATKTRQSPSLRTLRIRAVQSLSENSDDVYSYLRLSTIRGLLCVENLRILVLDVPVVLQFSSEAERRRCHICPAISSLLHTLEKLHLRLCRICPDVLKAQNPNGVLRLREVVLNLSLLEDAPGITAASHSRCCLPDTGVVKLMEDLHIQAQDLARQMVSPKTVRILKHALPTFKMQSLDVLTGKTMTLEDNAAWNADGHVDEDSDPESEISDTDDDSFFGDQS